MTELMIAAAAFIGLHLFVAGTGLRNLIVGAIGERPYLMLFALATAAILVWLVISYNAAAVSPENVIYWQAPAALVHPGSLILLIAFLLVVLGATTPTPSAVGGEKLLDTENPAKGMIRITRHPFLWGVMIWAAFHMGVNGERASQVFFGTFLIVAFIGTFAIDAKRTRRFGEAYLAFKAATSSVPFAAIIRRRNSFVFREIGWTRVALAILIWGGFLYGHLWLIGVSPFPSMRMP